MDGIELDMCLVTALPVLPSRLCRKRGIREFLVTIFMMKIIIVFMVWS